ncbi:MAG TPA: TetR/AcrR family transcriptional regulator [Gemmatimonadales bacterium]
MTGPAAKLSSRERIERAASAEFARRGFAGARVARIAERARVNKQLIFYYFGSKAGLYEAIVAAASDSVTREAETSPIGSASERLRAVIRSVHRALRDRPELVGVLFDRQTAADGAPPAAREALSRLTHEVGDVISQGQGLGFFRDDTDPDRLGLHAVVLCAGRLGLDPVLGRSSRM